MFDTVLQNLRLSDAADIAILAFVIYRLLLLMKGTRALSMAWGLLILIPLYLLARQLDLYTVSWILDRFSGYLVLAIIILFQDDIKRALARVGNPLFPILGRHAGTEVIEELVRAAFSLAARNVGALIAIEREASLQDYIEVGVRLDASTSHELLEAVFQPTSPIHDGAVVIQKNRIAAAGCFLPLTTNPEISKALVTRHRAAIGLTDDTDSVVLVVSEEEGRVSLVQGGKIRVMADPTALRQTLQSIFEIHQTRRLLRLRRAPDPVVKRG